MFFVLYMCDMHNLREEGKLQRIINLLGNNTSVNWYVYNTTALFLFMFVLKGSLSQLTWLELSSWISWTHLGPVPGYHSRTLHCLHGWNVPVYPRPGTLGPSLHYLHGWDIPVNPRTWD